MVNGRSVLLTEPYQLTEGLKFAHDLSQHLFFSQPSRFVSMPMVMNDWFKVRSILSERCKLN